MNTTAFTSAANVVAPAPSNANIIYVATIGSAAQSIAPKFLYSSNGGKTFTARSGRPNRFISDIYVDPQNPAHIWVSLSGFGTQHVYKSTNSGQSWQNVSTGLPNTPIGAIVVDTRPATPKIYVGTDVGVFRSTNNGASWSRFGTGLPNSVVMDLLLDRAHNTLTAATHGRGVWVTGL
jgi:ligand-binding sensor domain-containing protein